MILNYSRRTLLAFQLTANICALFGLIPFYNFQEKRFPRKKLFATYLGLLALVMIGLGAEPVWSIINTKHFGISHIVVIGAETLGVLICFTALYQSFFKRHVWERLFSEIASLEELNYLNTTGAREKSIIRTTNYQFGCMVILTAVLFCCETISISPASSIPHLLIFNTRFVYVIVHFLLTWLIGNMALILKNKFVDINDLLSSYKAANTSSLIKGTKKVKDLYSSMTDIVGCFNELFGPQFLLMGLHCSLRILLLSVMLVYTMFSTEYQGDNLVPIVAGVIYVCLLLVWLGGAMFFCDMAVEASEEIINVCYRIQLKHSVFSEPYKTIRNLLHLVNNSKIVFTAMNYYEINRSTLFELIGVTATYFVVLIQFYDGKKQ